jgi:wyosine [tRNA(Phe)-imidazoG37] synthetase (radical SAM superfamily)
VIFNEVQRKLGEATRRSERPEYLTFVPEGEPTLDISLGREISLLKQIGFPIAILSNASLLFYPDVKEDVLEADLISLKVDAVSESLWKRINRPHKALKLESVLESIVEFSYDFDGIIFSETMLIGGINYGSEFEKIADFLDHLKRLDKAYIAIPTRPPTEKWVRPAREKTLNTAFQSFSSKLGQNRVEYLVGYEGNAFACTGKVEEDLLSITAVHPMREEAVEEFLTKAGAGWQVIDKLVQERKLMETTYEGNTFYVRKLPMTND